MVALSDIFDVDELEAEVANGYVTRRFNDSNSLAILNYSPKSQYDNRWTGVTKACRGLIYDVETLEVVGRPFEKFFNHNQELAPDISDAKWFTVMDKADGSLIITAVHNEELVVATRGSFMSEQAFAAREILARTDWLPPVGMTYTFELVGPGNRIVLAYPEDTLIHLGKIDNETGRIFLPEDDTPFDSVQVFSFESLTDVFSAPPRPNAEGYVIYTDKGLVKWKQEDYIRAHSIVTGLSMLSVWRHLSSGGTVEELYGLVPDEFYPLLESFINPLVESFDKVKEICYSNFTLINTRGLSRKDFAAKASQVSHSKAMFALLDGKSIDDYVWKVIRPRENAIQTTE